jgi:hypothetical protein
MQTRVSLGIILCLGSVAVSGAAFAHALWTDPKPRDGKDGYKPGTTVFKLPCGVGRTATQPVTMWAAGKPRTVKFTETVPHEGCFLIEFAAAIRVRSSA